MVEPPILLFDLGGVLVKNSIFEDLPLLMREARLDGDLHELWLSCRTVQSFERGEIDAHTFASQFIAEWRLSMSPSEFLERFAGGRRASFQVQVRF